MTDHGHTPQTLASTTFAALCNGQPPSMGLYIERLYAEGGRRLQEHAWAPEDGELPITRLTIAGTDHVFFPQDTSTPHQRHIVLREMAARALCWSAPSEAAHSDGHPLSRLLPDLPDKVVEEALPQLPGQPDEIAVEQLATLMGYTTTRRLVRPGRALSALEPLRRALSGEPVSAAGAANGDVYLYRQVIDINDAMWGLRRHLSARARDQAAATVRQAGFTGDEAAAVAAAIEWRAALRSRALGHVEAQVLSLPPGGAGFADEVSRLVALAHAFHGVRVSRTPRAEAPPSLPQSGHLVEARALQ
ncbi:DUF6545 domain-containing protein [Streptomyces bobili]|uniref:DUF6545 domain-containing protein n=1 Tax=Streptomyces bobili TaxID=67280 RepID=UPI0034165CFF